MAKAVGIDLGTTNSAVAATMEGGRAEIIPNAEGGRTTPSVVAFTEDGQRLVGQVARRQAILNPDATIYSAKRFIGRKWGEVDDEAKIVSYQVVKGPNDAVRFQVRGRKYAPEETRAALCGPDEADQGQRPREPRPGLPVRRDEHPAARGSARRRGDRSGRRRTAAGRASTASGATPGTKRRSRMSATRNGG